KHLLYVFLGIASDGQQVRRRKLHLLLWSNQWRRNRDRKRRVFATSGREHSEPSALAQSPKSDFLWVDSRQLGQCVLSCDCIISERLIINALEGAGRITASSTVIDEHGDTHRWQAFAQVLVKRCCARRVRCTMQRYNRGQLVVAGFRKIHRPSQTHVTICKLDILRDDLVISLDMP